MKKADSSPPRFILLRSTFVFSLVVLGWAGFAGWVMPPLLVAEHPGPAVEALKRYIQGPPAPFLPRGSLDCWRDFSRAVLIASALYWTVISILRRHDLRAGAGRSMTEVRAARRTSLVLSILSLAFLAVTVLSGARHDYYFYVQMWCEVRQGHDPWFIVPGTNGLVPLNAYGPMFNLLAGLSPVSSLAPKLLFAYAYILFAVSQIKGLEAGGPSSVRRLLVLTALFWNPFPWVEIAIRGHFDILVGLCCLVAIREWGRGNDRLSGTSLAVGVLLKFMPAVLVPFLALDRGRLRPRFLFATLASIALGMGLSYCLWGPSSLLPLQLAATRRSTDLSIFWFIRGRYSPLRWFAPASNFDDLSTIILALALLRVWSWYRVRRPDLEGATLVAAVTTVVLYRTGYPQYQMVPFVLGSSWAVRHWAVIKGRTFRVTATACYFGWLAAFDLYYGFVDDGNANLYWDRVQDAVGLPAFLIGCAFLAAVVAASSNARTDGGRA